MAYTYKKLKNKIDEARYSNALENVLLLLTDNGMTKDEAENYFFDKRLEEIVYRDKLHSNTVADFVINQMKKELEKYK